MRRYNEFTFLHDTDSGMIRAMEVCKAYEKRDLTKMQERAKKRRKRLLVRRIKRTASGIAKAGYLLTILTSALTAMGLLNTPEELSQVDLIRLVLCVLWMAIPIAVLMVKGFKEDKDR